MSHENKTDYNARYKRIANSNWFKKLYENKLVTGKWYGELKDKVEYYQKPLGK